MKEIKIDNDVYRYYQELANKTKQNVNDEIDFGLKLYLIVRKMPDQVQKAILDLVMEYSGYNDAIKKNKN